MLRRAFLLFLAMMTGLSAAQAAEGVRPHHDAVAMAALASQRLGSASTVSRRAEVQVTSQRVGLCTGRPASDMIVAFATVPTVPCTYRSDRARE